MSNRGFAAARPAATGATQRAWQSEYQREFTWRRPDALARPAPVFGQPNAGLDEPETVQFEGLSPTFQPRKPKSVEFAVDEGLAPGGSSLAAFKSGGGHGPSLPSRPDEPGRERAAYSPLESAGFPGSSEATGQSLAAAGELSSGLAGRPASQAIHDDDTSYWRHGDEEAGAAVAQPTFMDKGLRGNEQSQRHLGQLSDDLGNMRLDGGAESNFLREIGSTASPGLNPSLGPNTSNNSSHPFSRSDYTQTDGNPSIYTNGRKGRSAHPTDHPERRRQPPSSAQTQPKHPSDPSNWVTSSQRQNIRAGDLRPHSAGPRPQESTETTLTAERPGSPTRPHPLRPANAWGIPEDEGTTLSARRTAHSSTEPREHPVPTMPVNPQHSLAVHSPRVAMTQPYSSQGAQEQYHQRAVDALKRYSEAKHTVEILQNRFQTEYQREFTIWPKTKLKPGDILPDANEPPVSMVTPRAGLKSPFSGGISLTDGSEDAKLANERGGARGSTHGRSSGPAVAQGVKSVSFASPLELTHPSEGFVARDSRSPDSAGPSPSPGEGEYSARPRQANYQAYQVPRTVRDDLHKNFLSNGKRHYPYRKDEIQMQLEDIRIEYPVSEDEPTSARPETTPDGWRGRILTPKFEPPTTYHLAQDLLQRARERNLELKVSGVQARTGLRT
ncbi:uncharacterized protein BJ171DRAFT_503153 [Polychytrium aggregatum]|uniref:uncharacterized protein n=1 Tax=Polychytrium aggregatum TaxID=110093 RepID=UPI0022FDE5F9|nr:uncharacterized protein BJ171DRAFT_503153 [Polychytrium aggregatum]KAI9205163.1 hypothetical protein BJ171DRAFT_503153 [Polychytrium aggregatum]